MATLIKEVDFGNCENPTPEQWILSITEAAGNLKDFYVDESKPLIHYEFLYKSIVKTTLEYFREIVSKFETLEMLEEQILNDQKMLAELKFYLTAERCIREMQNLESTDRVKVKMEIAKVYRWFEKRCLENS